MTDTTTQTEKTQQQSKV